MELNNETKLQLKKLLAKPTLVTQEHIPLLRNLMEDYPYFQPLHLLLAKAGLGTENEQSWLAKAAMYSNGYMLHQVIHEAHTLSPLENIALVSYESLPAPADLKIDKKEVAKEVTAAKEAPASSDKSIEEAEEVSNLPANETEDSSIEKFRPATDQDQQAEIQLENSATPQTDSEQAKVLSSADANIELSLLTAEPSATRTDNVKIVSPEIEGLPPLASEIITTTEDRPSPTAEVDEVLPKDEVIAKPLEAPEIEGLPPLAWETLPMCNVESAEITTEQDEDLTTVTVEEESVEPPEPVSAPKEEKPLAAIVKEITENEAEEIQPVETETPETTVEETPFVVPHIENLAPLQSELNKVGLGAQTQVTAESIGFKPDNSEVDNVNLLAQTEEVLSTTVDESEKQQGQTSEEHTESVGSEAEKLTMESVGESKPYLGDTANIEDQKNDDLVQQEQKEAVPIESITATDFFAFESNFKSEPIVEQRKQSEKDTISIEKHTTTQQLENIVSKYDDDKMPFTFLWWLSKTRKDHEQIFKPFTVAKQATPTGDLQQQYVENIFHLQSPFEGHMEAENNKTAKSVSKGSSLVEKFIKNDPQLKAPKPDQINTENKAKKSAEDNYDVVSETLADIYIEQMLYHKAIDTYQKLSLKFPEKSRYFADLILSLEKKI